MAIEDYVNEVHDILSNQGMGEKASLRRCAATANVSVTGNVVTFDLFAGEGSKVLPGQILSVVSPSDATKAYCFYVLSMSTDQVTAQNAYFGAPAIANASPDLDGAILYQNPTHLEHKIHSRVLEVLSRFTFPQIFAIDSTGLISTPNYITGEDELPSTVENIISAFQLDSLGSPVPIPFHVERNVHTTVSSTGVLGSFDLYDQTPLYYTYKRRLILGDEDTFTGLVELVATGAAALLMGATVAATDNERAKRDSATSRPESASQVLWRDFLAQRDSWSEDISRDTVRYFYIER